MRLHKEVQRLSLQKRMFKDLCNRRSAMGIQIKHFLNELLRRSPYVFKSVKLPSRETVQDLGRSLFIKWYISINHLIKYNSKRPDVNFLVIFLIIQQLWRHVVEAPTKCLPCGQSSCQSEVYHFRIHMLIQKYCLSFQITMDELTRVYVLDCRAYTSEYWAYVILFYLFTVYFLVQVSSCQEFKNNQQALLVGEILDDFYDIWVVYLSQKLNVFECFEFRSKLQDTKLLCVTVRQQLTGSKLPIVNDCRILLMLLDKLIFLHLFIIYLSRMYQLLTKLSTSFYQILQNANYDRQLLANMIRKLGIFTTSLVGGAAAYDVLSDSYVFTRNLRTIKCGLYILYAYKIAFNENNYLQIHESVAKMIYDTCIKNDGLYVKFGQGIATMDHLLPPPFYKHMSKLQDKAKSVSYQKISSLFQQQQGKTIQQSFSQFQRQPIASASIAQVHKAKLKNGQEVAVKIQKPNIKKQFGSDMAMHYLINFVLQYSFDLPLLHFVEDIQKNLKKQLDFRIQSSNAKLAEKNFKLLKRSQLHVPNIIDEFTRERILVSEWIDGIKITDQKELKKYGYNKKQIMNKLIRAFSDQIFITGFVHCDPHPGNVFVRPHPNNHKNFQIVILDHGLCISLKNQFRKQYSQFWKAMFLRDKEKMKQVCKKWGINMVEQFAGGQIMRPYNSQKMVNQKVERKDVIKLQHQMKTKMKEMMKQTINFPKQLIFVGRNMNLVRSLNKYYGGIADRIGILGKSAYIGAQTKDIQHPKTGFSYGWSSFTFNINLIVLDVTNWFIKKFSGKTIQQKFQQQSIKKTQQMFSKYGFKPLDQTAYNG